MAFQTSTSPYGFCIGVDGSDSDAFKIATGTGDVGTNTKLSIDNSGDVTISELLYVNNAVNHGRTTAGATFRAANNGNAAITLLSSANHSAGVGEDIVALNFAANNEWSTTKDGVYSQIRCENGNGSYADRGQLVFANAYNGNTISDRMVIDFDGNIGIGTMTPGENVHISSGAATSTTLKIEATATGERADINLYGIKTDNGGFAEILFVNNGDSTGAIACERIGANDAGELTFVTQATGAGMVEKMRITSTGHIVAQYLNQTGSTSNRYPLYWVHSGTNGSIEPYTGSVDWVHSLTPKSFKFRDFEDTDDGRVYLDTTNDNPNTEYGLIAEEVNEVEGSDYIVDKDSDGNVKGVLYHNLVPVLLKAVQELSAKVEVLEGN